jgi:hypothetical protein
MAAVDAHTEYDRIEPDFMTIKHSTVVAVADDGTSPVGSDEWNANHSVVTDLSPDTSDGATLGTTSKMWSDLFLASGAVVNYNNSAYTITHSAAGLAYSKGFSLTDVNPSIGNDASSRRAVDLTVYSDSSTSNPNFSNEAGVTLQYYGRMGQATNNVSTQAKKTFLPLTISATYHASGQKFIQSSSLVSYGMSDTATHARHLVQYAGGPVSGDEGQGYGMFSLLTQQPFRSSGVIATVTRTTYDTTTTQAITASKDPQTITVTSTTNANVGDWIVVGQELPIGTPNLEAVKITAIGVGTITGTFRFNHLSGVTIKPALVLTSGDAGFFGQDRVLVNLSGSSYTTGTAKGDNTATITGIGTTWTASMVGGDALNFGAISMSADDYSGAPFAASALKSWHQIVSVSSTTTLAIHSYSVAGDAQYKGRQKTTSAAYTIRPAARILVMETDPANPAALTNKVICEYSPHTWTAGDTIECVVCPYADVSGFQYAVTTFAPCGTNRAFMLARNTGPTKWDAGYKVDAFPPVGYFDADGWGVGFDASGGCTVGASLAGSTAAILLASGSGAGNAGKISWSGAGTYVKDTDTVPGVSHGLVLGFTEHGNALTGYTPSVGGDAESARLSWDGNFQVAPKTFAKLVAASSTLRGCIACVTDSSTATWGATITGGGSNVVLAFCNGTNWTVMGK